MHTGQASLSLSASLPSSQWRTYRLLACPDALTTARIEEEQLFFRTQFSSPCGAQEPPAILLAHFEAKEMLEATLLRWIQRICSLQEPFTVTLNNFSGLPPHTIYLRVQDPAPFGRLAAQLRMVDSFLQSNDSPPARLISRPCLPLAAALPADLYDAAIQAYTRRSFHASFPLQTLVLQQRSHEGEPFRLVNTFTLPMLYS
jgi:hypothetical protein